MFATRVPGDYGLGYSQNIFCLTISLSWTFSDLYTVMIPTKKRHINDN
ncbi:hypothetical protein DSUL_40114 [Desulfovibrionales bacterium]